MLPVLLTTADFGTAPDSAGTAPHPAATAGMGQDSSLPQRSPTALDPAQQGKAGGNKHARWRPHTEHNTCCYFWGWSNQVKPGHTCSNSSVDRVTDPSAWTI
jgi:hypothetical protein